MCERIRRAEKIREALNELYTIEKIEERLSSHFFYPKIKQNPTFQEHVKQSKKYLKAIRLALRGVLYENISKECTTPRDTVARWLTGREPYLIMLAKSIPSKTPTNGKWLPIRIKRYANPVDFILVPEKIDNYTDIHFVLGQLTSQKLKDAEIAFGYVLGMLISDTSKPKGYSISNQALLCLTRKYDWSLEIGNSFCYYWNLLGLGAKRIKDNNKLRKRSPHGEFRWITEKSPFIRWLLNVCLGLKENETTTYHKVNAKWIIGMPETFRKAFIQGICDGDGSAHNFRRVEISCDPNQKFIVELLETFGISSCIDDDSVVVHNKHSLLKTAEIPIFKHATGRLIALNKIIDMVKNPPTRAYHIQKKLNDDVHKLRKQGFSAGMISEIIYDKYGFGLFPSAIYARLKKHDTDFYSAQPNKINEKNKDHNTWRRGPGLSQLPRLFQG